MSSCLHIAIHARPVEASTNNGPLDDIYNNPITSIQCAPPVKSRFINTKNYGYKYHKP